MRILTFTTQKKKSNAPPGPRERFPYDSLLKLHRDPLGFMTRLAQQYGDVAHFRGGALDAYLVSKPEWIKEVLTTHHRDLPVGIWQRQARRLLGNGLVTSEGDQHLKQRRMISPGFHHSRLAGLSRFSADCTEAWMSEWSDGQVLETGGEFWKLTLKIVAQSLFSADVRAELQELLDTMNGVVELASPAMIYFAEAVLSLPLPFTARFDRARARLDTTIYRIIAQHRADLNRDDLLAMLLDMQDENGVGMTDEELRDQTLTLLMAGHGTTSIALMWAFYLVSQHPKQEDAWLREIDTVLGDRVPTVNDLKQLPYTRAVFAEALRLYPPVWAQDREAARNITLGEYVIPKGAVVLVSQWVTQRDARWFHDPNAFVPERWLENPDLYARRTVYFPFGLGPRVCVGEEYGWMNGILIMATIARKWRLRLTLGQKVELLPRSGLGSKYGMRMVCAAR